MEAANETGQHETIEHALGLTEAEYGEYGRKQRRFWHLLRRGIEPGPWVMVEVDLTEAVQIPSGAGRRDLIEEMRAMETVPELRDILAVSLGGELDTEAVAGAGGVLISHDAQETVLHAVIEGTRDWSEHLGGAAGGGEIERRFEITVRRAPWRDRKVRRFAKILIVSVQIHPDPIASAL
jgi:hypothetical protein